VARDLQCLLPCQDEYDKDDEQERAHDAPLRAEQCRVHRLCKAGAWGRGMTHTEGIGRMRDF
jgi:hypothetical protein